MDIKINIKEINMLNKLVLSFAFAMSLSVANATDVKCDKTTTKETVAKADEACNKAKAGDICILANNPPSCGAPGAAGAACKRDKACASGACDMAASKCK